MNETQPADTLPRSQASPWPFLIVAALLAAAVGVLVGLQGREVSQTRHSPPLQGVHLQPLLGTDKVLGDQDLRGKVVLMNFWGTWCQPCLEEFPHLHALYRQLQDRREFQLVFVVCLPPGEPYDEEFLREQTQAFLDQYNAQVPVFTDPDQKTRQALARYGAWQGAYPTTVLLDRQGRLRHLWVGYRPGTEVEMLNRVLELLNAP